MCERTWICEPNDRISDQGFGVKNMHEWWLSQGQACKKVACGSKFWERKFWERWESVLIRNMSNSHHKILFETQNDLFAGLPKYNTTIITIKQTNQCDFMDEFLFNNKCSTSNDFVSFQIFNNYRVIGSWTRVLKCQILWKKKVTESSVKYK